MREELEGGARVDWVRRRQEDLKALRHRHPEEGWEATSKCESGGMVVRSDRGGGEYGFMDEWHNRG